MKGTLIAAHHYVFSSKMLGGIFHGGEVASANGCVGLRNFATNAISTPSWLLVSRISAMASRLDIARYLCDDNRVNDRRSPTPESTVPVALR